MQIVFFVGVLLIGMPVTMLAQDVPWAEYDNPAFADSIIDLNNTIAQPAEMFALRDTLLLALYDTKQARGSRNAPELYAVTKTNEVRVMFEFCSGFSADTASAKLIILRRWIDVRPDLQPRLLVADIQTRIAKNKNDPGTCTVWFNAARRAGNEPNDVFESVSRDTCENDAQRKQLFINFFQK